MFEGNFQEESIQIENYSGYKAPLMTCNTLQRGSSMMSPNFNHLEGFVSPVDLSIDRLLSANNAKVIEGDLLSYLKHCLGQAYPQEDPIASGKLFRFPSLTNLENEADSELDALIHQNPLLNEWTQKILLENFKEFHQLNSLFVELMERIGAGLSQEIIYILFVILQRKMPAFKELMDQKETDWLIPKFDRFWSEDGADKETDSDFKTYGEVEPEEVKNFASKDVEQIAKSIYFSNALKYLTLKEVKVEIRPNLKLVDKFTTFVIHVCRAIFLTMAGMAVPDQDVEQFLSELCLHTSEEGDVVGSELTKRVKQ